MCQAASLGLRRTAHLIMLLVWLFHICWVLQVAAVTNYNQNGGRHAEGLLTVAHFSASVFVGFSPMVVALGQQAPPKYLQYDAGLRSVF